MSLFSFCLQFVVAPLSAHLFSSQWLRWTFKAIVRNYSVHFSEFFCLKYFDTVSVLNSEKPYFV